MSTFKPFQRKNQPTTPTYPSLRPARPLMSPQTSTTEQVKTAMQTQLNHATCFKRSLEQISILPLAIDNADMNKARLAPMRDAVEQANSMSVSPPSATHIPLFSTVQRKAIFPSPFQEESQLGSRIQAARSSGHSLDKQTQQRLELELDTDLSCIRIHTDNEANYLAHSVNAVAFTTGPDIFFRRGMYNPDSLHGLHLLAHEATHVVQQAKEQITTPSEAADVSISDPQDHFEQAAEITANRITATTNGKAKQVAGSSTSPVSLHSIIGRRPRNAFAQVREGNTISFTTGIHLQRMVANNLDQGMNVKIIKQQSQNRGKIVTIENLYQDGTEYNVKFPNGQTHHYPFAELEYVFKEKEGDKRSRDIIESIGPWGIWEEVHVGQHQNEVPWHVKFDSKRKIYVQAAFGGINNRQMFGFSDPAGYHGSSGWGLEDYAIEDQLVVKGTARDNQLARKVSEEKEKMWKLANTLSSQAVQQGFVQQRQGQERGAKRRRF